MSEKRVDAHKYTPEFGLILAESLWQHYVSLGVEFAGKNVLDFGCHWGYFPMLAIERGCKSVVGVDIQPHWECIDTKSLFDRSGLELVAGDLLELPDMQNKSFDMIVSSGTLFLLTSEYLDHLLAWFFDHLIPGGCAVLRTRCLTAKSFNDLGTKLNIPGSQLLFSRRIINQVVREKGCSLNEHIPYTGATWIMACRGAGFDVMDVVRGSNAEVARMTEIHSAKTHWIDQAEIKTSEITLLLRRSCVLDDLAPIRKDF